MRIFSSVGIGDIVTLGPLVRKLKSVYPESRISIVSTKKGYSQNVEELFYIDEIVILNGIKEFFRLFTRKTDFLIFLGYYSKLSGPLKVLLYHFLFFSLRSNEKIKYSELETPEFKNVNMVEMKINILKKSNIEIAKGDYDLFIPFSFEKEKKLIKERLKKEKFILDKFLVGIHLGKKKGYLNYQWPTKKWVEIINYLEKNYNAKIIFVGGKNEKQQIKEIVSQLDFFPLNLTEKLSIRGTTALISYCDLFISTNSGPMWLAAALRKPQIALCGPSFFNWDPYNKNAIVIRKIINRKYCNPPCDAKECKYGDNLCMESISIEGVKRVIDKIIGARGV